MIKLFDPDNYLIDTSSFKNLLHDESIIEFENSFADFIGAKYACSINSATNAIFLLFLNKNIEVNIPSMIPPVVLNALVTSGNKINFIDDPYWIGNSYILHKFQDYKIIDSAQKVERNQFKNEALDNDVMFFSFYPTKPIGGLDGGMIVSNDKEKINWIREAVMNGMSYADNNWERKIKFPGYKMYMNAVQAFIANKNFKKIEENNQKLNEIKEFYNEKLNLNNKSNHLYRIEIDDNKKFISYMKNFNITCGIHYECQHKNTLYTNKKFNCPNSEILSKKTVSIPYHTKLSKNDLLFIIEKINTYE
jgi:dTDP-4-amino-4,6-dideoxygalactose transaminase